MPAAAAGAREVLTAAEDARATGRLRFHDLLVLARDLLRAVRGRAASVCRSATGGCCSTRPRTPTRSRSSSPSGSPAAPTADGPWHDVDVAAGSLFFVGDAKQSIYRFRRADIRTYLAGPAALGETVALTTNFRSSPAVLDWVNAVFGRLVDETAACSRSTGRSTSDRRCAAVRVGDACWGVAHRRRVAAPRLREAEARDIAGLIVTACARGLEGRRPRARAGRAAAPARRHHDPPADPERDLRDRRRRSTRPAIPYRTEAASIVYSADRGA